jgi:glycosyltransferase involved in cell wall biosynthesis
VPRPRVSVIITAWNAERFIGEALASVAAQTVQAHQIVVNDDGSTDGTVAAIRASGVHVDLLESPHEGISEGRNRAMARATGDLLAFLDADDVWLPTKLERQLELLEERPELDAVFCRTDEFADGAGARHRAPARGAVGPLLSGVVVRAAVLDRAGGFRPGLRSGDWLEWWARATDAGMQAEEVPEVLMRRRLHEENNSLREASSRDLLSIFRARIERDRQGAG